MIASATNLGRLFCLLLAFACLTAGTAMAQDEPVPVLEDDFIFFAEGANVLVPTANGDIVADPMDPASGNQVLRYNYGTWSHQGFAWPSAAGADATTFVSDVIGEGDTLYLRLLSHPDNAGKGGVSLMFTDKTDGTGASRADLESGTATGELEQRLIWTIPQELHDGQWHELAIPLPLKTNAAHQAAKDAGTLDPMAALWTYPGGWANAGFGFGPGWTDASDPLYEDFQWDAVKVFGVFWDNNAGGGPIYVDDMYIGGPDTDLGMALNPPAAMSGVTFTAAEGKNVISWTPTAEFGGYRVYASLEAITDVSDPGVALLATIPFSADAFEVVHPYQVPHASMAPMPIHYAVTSMNLFGTENPNVSASSATVTNPHLRIQPFIGELTTDESDEIYQNILDGNVTSEGFPSWLQPFDVNTETMKLGDTSPQPLPSATDLSAKIWMGYTAENELFVYSEIMDDTIRFAGLDVGGSQAWGYDSFEFNWGSYDVHDVGGNVLKGSTHRSMTRGPVADYQIRLAPGIATNGEVSSMQPFAGWSIDQPIGESAYAPLTDATGKVIGYKMLSWIPMLDARNTGASDVVMDPPSSDEIAYIPIILALNDADGSTASPPRELQIVWSGRPETQSNWWNDPAQFPVVAMVGRNRVATDVEQVDGSVPARFALEANYPNPFNPQTTIRFQLATPETVTLSVYNVLGQQVSVLLAGQAMGAGRYDVRFDATSLPSGVYFYRLDAGASFSQTRRMLLVK